MKKYYSTARLEPHSNFTDQQLEDEIKAVAKKHNFLLDELEADYTGNLIKFARTSSFKSLECLRQFIERALRSAPVK